MKAKLGLEDDEIDNDTPEEMRQYLANILDSTLRSIVCIFFLAKIDPLTLQEAGGLCMPFL